MLDAAGNAPHLAGFQRARLSADRELHPAADDDAALLTLVREHVLARVGAGRITLVHDRHRAIRPLRGDQLQRNIPIADVGQLMA